MKKVGTNMSLMFLLVLLALSSVQAPKDYGTHDPCNIVKDGNTYYTFYTSNGVECAYSTDLCTWRKGGRVFASGFPSWINQYVSGFGGHFWAPEVFYMNGKWHVYYSCSSFGSRSSAIGVATSPSLKNPQWQDQGMVVYTNGSSNHNAIDADVMRTSDGKVFLVYGSFWNGIVMTELDTITGKPKNRTNLTYVANGNPEAAVLIQHDNYYYLVFNRGKCCSGVNSTYQIFVGRSTSPNGPFTDKNGTRTSSGGGTLLLSTRGRFIGPGHFGYFTENGREYMSYHYYDGNQNGASKLKINTLSWENGWPIVNVDFDPCNPGIVKDCAGVDNGTAYVDNCNVCVSGSTGKQPCTQDCNGEWGGSAYLDTCGVCVDGNTGVTPCVGLIEGEDASKYEGVVESVNTGHIGNGYLNLNNAAGSAATWSVCADTAVHTSLFFRYANGSIAERNVSVSVNETVQVNSLLIPSTGTWTDWETVKLSLQLKKGENHITLASLTSDGGPNIDAITFSDLHLSQCAATYTGKTVPAVKKPLVKYAGGVISLNIEKDDRISLSIYSVSGRLIRTLFSGKANRGNIRVNAKLSGINKGTYLLVFKNSGNVKYEKIISIW